MFCNNCGKEILNESAKFCPYCGADLSPKTEAQTIPDLASLNTDNVYTEPVKETVVEQAQPTQSAQPTYTYNQTVNTEVKPSSTNVLVWGILATALSWIPVAGLVIAIIAMGKPKKYYRNGGEKSGKVTAGKVLSIVGLVSSIGWTIYWLVIVIIIIIGTSGSFSGGSGKYYY